MQIGDTVTEAARPTKEPFPGYQEIKPMVFAGLYPVDTNQYEELRDAMDKLRLNDASFFTSRNRRPRWALAFAAAFSVCCTWRSCRSVWNASSISI